MDQQRQPEAAPTTPLRDEPRTPAPRTDGITISVNFIPGGKSIELNVNASDTVANLQQLIYHSEGISPKDQRLYFDCQVLDRVFQLRHNGKLDGYIITDGSVVQCVCFTTTRSGS